MTLGCQLLHEVNPEITRKYQQFNDLLYNNRSYKLFVESDNQETMGAQQPSNEMYNLRWNNYSANLIKVFFEHHEHEYLVDVTLSCEKHFIKAHRLVLSACSGYFAKVFESHATPNFMILMNNVKYKYLKLIIQYMYQGEVKVADEDIQEFLALGKVLEVKGLCSVELKDGEAGEKMAMKRTNDGEEKGSECTPEKCFPLPVMPNTVVDGHSTKKMKTSSIKTSQALVAPVQPPKIRLDVLKMDSRLVRNSLPVGQQPKSVLRMESILLPRATPKSVTNNSRKRTSNKSSTILPLSDTQDEILLKTPSHIPRPPNAFMIFANQWRKKLAVEYPDASNKDISVKLGAMWKNLDAENKDAFYKEAEKASREHKLKYPGYNPVEIKTYIRYSYSPKEARERKAVSKKILENVQTTSDVDTLDNDDSVGLCIDEDFKDMVVEVDCDD